MILSRPLKSHSFGVRLKLFGQISHSHSKPTKSHYFECQVSHFSLFATLTSLHVVHCESHRFHKQNLTTLCSIASLVKTSSYTNGIFYITFIAFLLKFVASMLMHQLAGLASHMYAVLLADGMSHSKLANLTPNSCQSHYFGHFKVERSVIFIEQ